MSAAPNVPTHGREAERVVARLRGGEAGPLLIAIGGLHGNEPSGVDALGRVATAVDSRTLHGDVVMVAGNLGALAAGRRFVDHDLNRGWSAERLATLRGQDASAPGDAEDKEQLELARVIDEALASARGPAFLLDLHATSAEGIPFALCRDDPAARRFAASFPITLVLGLIESLSGTLAGFLGARCTSVVVEGGRNSSPATVDRHEAVVWLALAAAGILDHAAVPALEVYRDVLTRARGDLPRTLSVEHRHAIAPDDRFRMEPGFSNIHRIRAGELLARDRRGAIHAPEAGFLLMPLYQAMGDDGFFLGRDSGDDLPDA